MLRRNKQQTRYANKHTREHFDFEEGGKTPIGTTSLIPEIIWRMYLDAWNDGTSYGVREPTSWIKHKSPTRWQNDKIATMKTTTTTKRRKQKFIYHFWWALSTCSHPWCECCCSLLLLLMSVSLSIISHASHMRSSAWDNDKGTSNELIIILKCRKNEEQKNTLQLGSQWVSCVLPNFVISNLIKSRIICLILCRISASSLSYSYSSYFVNFI